MYQLSVNAVELPMKDFIHTYRDAEKFMEYCRQCGNYNKVWTCPSVDFDLGEYLNRYGYVYLNAVKICYDEDFIEASGKGEQAVAAGRQTLYEVREKIAHVLLAVERKYKDTAVLFPGSCHFCKECARAQAEPCRFPEKMRYSLDTFGFDLGKLATDAFGIELQWSDGGLPPYYTLISAVLSTPRQEEITTAILEGFEAL